MKRCYECTQSKRGKKEEEEEVETEWKINAETILLKMQIFVI